MKNLAIILYLIVCVAIGASADGLSISGGKLLAHSLEALEILMLLSAALLFKLVGWRQWLILIISYTLFRIVGFDYIHNLVAGLPWNYIGGTSRWDLFLASQPQHGIVFARVIFLIAAIFVPIKEF